MPQRRPGRQNHEGRERRGRSPGATRVGVSLLAAVLQGTLSPYPSSAQTTFPGADEWAAAIVEQTTPKWEGPVVEPPEERPRPAGAVPAAVSAWRPLTVHAGPGVSPARATAALEALEAAAEDLETWGWPAPFPDGGRGDTAGFDLYLVRGGATGAEAYPDAPIPWHHLDAVSSFAIVDATVEPAGFVACVTSAYAQALLLGQDPAEARAWRRATGAWLAWQLTGHFGCDDAVTEQQREPWRSWVSGGAREGAGGGLLLALLSAMHDRDEEPRFIRDVWQLARQQTLPSNPKLRGGPDVWMAIAHAVTESGDKLAEELVDVAVMRWFSGDPAREAVAPASVPRGLGPEAAPPVQWNVRWEDLPHHTSAAEPALEPIGSAYALVDVRKAPPGSQLRVWLRGEYGVRWSLVAVRLDARGREMLRIPAPPRREPRSYVPVELDEGTAHVLLVITNLSSRLPDADVPDENVRSFKLIVDRG